MDRKELAELIAAKTEELKALVRVQQLLEWQHAYGPLREKQEPQPEPEPPQEPKRKWGDMVIQAVATKGSPNAGTLALQRRGLVRRFLNRNGPTALFKISQSLNMDTSHVQAALACDDFRQVEAGVWKLVKAYAGERSKEAAAS